MVLLPACLQIEAAAFAESEGWPKEDLEDVARRVSAAAPEHCSAVPARPRVGRAGPIPCACFRRRLLLRAQISRLPKANGARARVVVITQGSQPTIVATGGRTTLYAVPKVTAHSQHQGSRCTGLSCSGRLTCTPGRAPAQIKPLGG